MLLVIDVGNTNIVMGIFQAQELVQNWRIRTERNTTEDEFFVLATNLFARSHIKASHINQSIISCVVPPMVEILEAFCHKYLGHAPKWVNARSYPGMPIRVPNPNEVGADRIVNAVAAYKRHNTAMIVIDFGTATTFDVISTAGEYLGGAISPGIGIAAEALFRNASKLPRVEILAPPDTVVGKDTSSSIQSGIIFGYAALVDGMVARIRQEMPCKLKVIATGGLANLLAQVSQTIDVVEPNLTLEGLRIISNAWTTA
jgi:type III pantothenate kinase